jgi:hypothetical protein
VVTGDSRHLLGSVEDLADIGTAPAYPHGRLMVAPTRRYPFDVRMAVGVSGGIFGRRNRWCGRHWRGGVLARAPIRGTRVPVHMLAELVPSRGRARYRRGKCDRRSDE